MTLYITQAGVVGEVDTFVGSFAVSVCMSV